MRNDEENYMSVLDQADAEELQSDEDYDSGASSSGSSDQEMKKIILVGPSYLSPPKIVSLRVCLLSKIILNILRMVQNFHSWKKLKQTKLLSPKKSLVENFY